MKIREIVAENIEEVVGFAQNTRSTSFPRRTMKKLSLADILLHKKAQLDKDKNKSELQKFGKNWASAK